MKNIFDFDLEENNLSEIKPVSLDLEMVKNNIPTFSSQKLCEMIVCNRYFKFYEEITVLCMEELAKRRDAGQNYDFESYIEQASKELPNLNFDMPDLRSVLKQISTIKK